MEVRTGSGNIGKQRARAKLGKQKASANEGKQLLTTLTRVGMNLHNVLNMMEVPDPMYKGCVPMTFNNRFGLQRVHLLNGVIRDLGVNNDGSYHCHFLTRFACSLFSLDDNAHYCR